MTIYFIQAFIYLIAAVIAVPLAKRFGLGSVLGYLIAGVVIGPVVGLVGDETTTIQHFAEFGVVMMLFLVGLELEPKMLWSMRHRLLGLGGLQVFLTAASAAGLGLLFDLPWTVAVTIGLIFSLSSTAIVLQTLQEKGLMSSDAGRSAFSVLLFQDIAVIPMLAFIPLLALPELVEAAASLQVAAEHHEELNLLAGLPGWAYAIALFSSIAAVVVGGHYLSRPIFKYVASAGLREISTAAALALVIGIAALMSLVGLSPALGTFLAGVVLANSEFRHELESNIEPFKGLLLGLFFITVGAGIDFGILFSEFGLIIGLTLGLIALKAGILLLLSFPFKVKGSDRWLFALSLAQAGEFGFVLLSFSTQNHALPLDISQRLSLVVALSMLLTPALFIAFERLILPIYEKRQSKTQEPDKVDDQGPVLVAGTGRFGQIVNRLLAANDVKTIVFDQSLSAIEVMRNIGIKSYFGDATRMDLLETAGVGQASLFVVAIDDRQRATELVLELKHAYPKLKILARSYDRGHQYELRQAGADYVVNETYYSALEMAQQSMIELGMHPFKATGLRNSFAKTEEKSRDILYETWLASTEDNKFNANYRELFMQFEDALRNANKRERNEGHSLERSWTPPPKGYAEEFE
ncbi:potassium transporter [Alginatibacterium sediminis]|uniref:Potassium transporter n=1 Tax=Alginatibacterium sediminis TaxID=2164068 RepID=A0A420E9I3_9ALTE|nr:monovalent cation:proton antiporter-2 (CPA2) family protein [Alginatibacterium sediminis]RKF15752.1 potassium transporter [Alginatibacterium sediminis]